MGFAFRRRCWIAEEHLSGCRRNQTQGKPPGLGTWMAGQLREALLRFDLRGLQEAHMDLVVQHSQIAVGPEDILHGLEEAVRAGVVAVHQAEVLLAVPFH